MSNIISIRLKEKELEALEALAEAEQLDRTTLIRQLLADAIGRRKLELARRYYEEGYSFEASAKKAQIDLWELIDYFEEKR